MKQHSDKQHKPPVIPPTLSEEYRFWDQGEGTTLATAPKKSEDRSERHLTLKKTMLMPIVAVAAAATVVSAAAHMDPLNVISKLIVHEHQYEWQHNSWLDYEKYREEHPDEEDFEFIEGHWQRCRICGHETEIEEHEWGVLGDEDGHWWGCVICGYASGEEFGEIEKQPHEGGEADCAHGAVCEVCGKEYGEPDPENHQGQTEVRGRKEATQTEAGYTGDVYCLDCGKMIKEGEMIEPGGHEHNYVWNHDVVTENGELREVHWQVCSICGEETAKENHEWSEASNESYHWWECTVCGYISGDEKMPHAGGQATCVKRAVCDTCGREYGELDPNNHQGETEVRGYVEPTDLTDGYTGDTYCKDCGALISEGSSIPADGHEHIFGWSYADGEHWQLCSVCGEIINRGPHNYTWKWSEDGGEEYHYQECPDCGATTSHERHLWELMADEDYHWWQCSECGHISGDERMAHEGGTATCVSRAVCRTCNTEYGALDTANHTGGTELRNARAATEDAEGYTGDTYCLGCGGLISRGSAIARLSHTHNMSYTAAKSASCTAEGNIAYYYCSSCGNYFTDRAGSNQVSASQITIAKTAHSYAYRNDGSDHWQVCSVCGDTTTHTAHTYGEWNVTTAATCTAAGSQSHACSACGYSATETIRALGHSYVRTTAACVRCGIKVVTLSGSGLELTPGNSGSPIVMAANDTLALSAEFRNGITYSDLTFTATSDSATASVISARASDTSCTVIANAAGTGRLVMKFTYNKVEFTLTYYFTVMSRPSITMDRTEMSLFTDEAPTVSATLNDPINSGDKLGFTSSDTTVVRVNSTTGKLTPVSAGTATITASYTYTSSGVAKTTRKTCTVTVKDYHYGPSNKPIEGTGWISYMYYTDDNEYQTTIYGYEYDPDTGTDGLVTNSAYGISYNSSTNTLTLNNVNGPTGTLTIENMGSLTINVVGTNRLEMINCSSSGLPLELIFGGSGKLTINEHELGEGIYISAYELNGENDMYIYVKNSVTLDVYGGSPAAISIYSSTGAGIEYSGTMTGGTPSRYTDQWYTIMNNGMMSKHVVFSPA